MNFLEIDVVNIKYASQKVEFHINIMNETLGAPAPGAFGKLVTQVDGAGVTPTALSVTNKDGISSYVGVLAAPGTAATLDVTFVFNTSGQVVHNSPKITVTLDRSSGNLVAEAYTLADIPDPVVFTTSFDTINYKVVGSNIEFEVWVRNDDPDQLAPEFYGVPVLTVNDDDVTSLIQNLAYFSQDGMTLYTGSVPTSLFPAKETGWYLRWDFVSYSGGHSNASTINGSPNQPPRRTNIPVADWISLGRYKTNQQPKIAVL